MPQTANKASLTLRNTAIILLVLIPLSALGTRFQLWPYTTGLLLLALAVLGSLIIELIIAVCLLRKPTAANKKALRWAGLFALPPILLIAAIMGGNDSSRAPIHNISTDTNTPPEFVNAIKLRGEASNLVAMTAEVAKIQREVYPDIAPIESPLSPSQAFAQALATAEAMGWEIHHQNPESGQIEALTTSFWFGFKDDIAIRVRPSVNGSRIDLHSVSRVGRGDLGANAKRIRQFTALFVQ